jgi:hypothetical protein
LHAKKDEIEKAFGAPLEWDRLDARRASRIRKSINLGGWKDPDKWSEIHVAMVDAMISLEKALKPFIHSLDVEAA